MKKTMAILACTLLLACHTNTRETVMSNINDQTVATVLSRLDSQEELYEQAERGVRQAAALWREEDGSREEFTDFCLEYFCSSFSNLLFS